MNERIRELWRACVLKHTNDPMNWQMVADEFAELIVRECARIVPNTDLGDVDGGDSAVLRAASKQIREHFGVK